MATAFSNSNLPDRDFGLLQVEIRSCGDGDLFLELPLDIFDPLGILLDQQDREVLADDLTCGDLRGALARIPCPESDREQFPGLQRRGWWFCPSCRNRKWCDSATSCIALSAARIHITGTLSASRCSFVAILEREFLSPANIYQPEIR